MEIYWMYHISFTPGLELPRSSVQARSCLSAFDSLHATFLLFSIARTGRASPPDRDRGGRTPEPPYALGVLFPLRLLFPPVSELFHGTGAKSEQSQALPPGCQSLGRRNGGERHG